MTVKAILFDMDGVLLMSTRAHKAGFTYALNKLGIRKWDYSAIAGMKTDASFKKLLKVHKRPSSPALIEQMTREKRAIAHQLLTRKTPVRAGATRLLQSLNKKVRLALV